MNDIAQRLLFTQWGTVVFADDSGVLRHGPYGKIPLNVWLAAEDVLHIAGRAPQPVTVAPAERGIARHIQREGVFYGAEPDGTVSASRGVMIGPDRFMLLAPEQLRDIAAIQASDWTLPDGQVIEAAKIVFGADFVLNFGHLKIKLDDGPGVIAHARNGAQISALRFLHDGWKTGTARRFRPLIYFCVFGPNHLFEMLKTCLHSIALHGEYHGEIFILTDRAPRDVVGYVPPNLPNKITLLARDARNAVEMLASRYDFSDLPMQEFQPVLYLDADMICNAPLKPILVTANAAERFFVTSEFGGRPLGAIPEPIAPWFGDFLFRGAGLDPADARCMNSGAIAFPNVDFAMPIFRLIEGTMREYRRGVAGLDEFGDQPFASYVLQSQGLVDTASLNPYILFRRENFRPENPPTGLVHFNDGVGANKLGAMTAYLKSISEPAPAPQTGIREIAPGMRINRSIPGQMSDAELMRLIELAAAVPEGGVIVEVGCLYGLSSWHIAQHCKPGVTLFCVDPWQRENWIIEVVEKPQKAPPFGRGAFEKFTADCNNIVMLQGFSPDVARGWRLPIDMYVEDAVHNNPVLGRNIAFWSGFVKPGGTVSGHDYCAQFPDVITEVDQLAAKLGSEVRVAETFWSVRK